METAITAAQEFDEAHKIRLNNFSRLCWCPKLVKENNKYDSVPKNVLHKM